MKKQYDTSGITEMNYQPLIVSFMNRIPRYGSDHQRTYTTGHSLVISGYEIARFWGKDVQIKFESMIPSEVYNLIPGVNITFINPTDYPKVYLNGIEITDFDNWIFVKNGH